MNTLVVRWSEIGTKSSPVKKQMIQVLRQRVEERLEQSGLEYEKVSWNSGRIYAEVENAERAAKKVKNLPGVQTVSPAIRTEPELESIKEASKSFEYGESFGVAPNTGNTELSTPEIAKELGAYVQELTGTEVDLEEPETWLGIDVRNERALLFTEKIQGPGGFPAGSQGDYAALISGGIDSPVAAYEIMTRGADITPIYFYNKPIAAGDHLLRFKASTKKLKKFFPGKKWKAYIVDMEEVNERLMDVGKGLMIVHRRIMFKVAEKIVEKEGLDSIVAGESLGQKSSQTPQNLEITSKAVEKNIFRPLLSWDKNSISNKAREIGTFEEAEIDSACRSLSPENPATELKKDELQGLLDEIDEDELVEKALDSVEVTEI